jgi:nitrogenase-stabilizing/protective protein
VPTTDPTGPTDPTDPTDMTDPAGQTDPTDLIDPAGSVLAAVGAAEVDGGGHATTLLACRNAEDYFAALDVPFDPQVLRVNRLHILRMFGPALQAYLAGPMDDEPQAAERLRSALATAHDTFTSSTALDHRLFKVLQDRAPRGFVSLGSVTVEPAPSRAEPAPSRAEPVANQEVTR